MTIFKDFENILNAQNPSILDYFNPGLTAENVVAIFSELNLPIHKNLVNMFVWRNGMNYNQLDFPDSPWGNSGAFLPLMDLVEVYNYRKQEEYIVGNERLDGFLFPITYDDDLLICLKPDSGLWGSIFFSIFWSSYS